MREMATVRTNILLTQTEHRHWTKRAREGGVSLAEFVRRSVALAEDSPTTEELAELESLAAELSAATERTHAVLDETLAQLRRSNSPETEAAMRERVRLDLERSPVEIDPEILDFSVA